MGGYIKVAEFPYYHIILWFHNLDQKHQPISQWARQDLTLLQKAWFYQMSICRYGHGH